MYPAFFNVVALLAIPCLLRFGQVGAAAPMMITHPKDLAGMTLDPTGMTGICLNQGCPKFAGMYKKDKCDVTFKCSDCSLSSKTRQENPTSKHCVSMPKPSSSSVELAVGHLESDYKLIGSFFGKKRGTEKLKAHWDTHPQLSIDHCKVENFDFQEGLKHLFGNEKNTKFVANWFKRISLMVGVTKVSNTFFNRQIAVDIIYHPSQEDEEFSKEVSSSAKPCKAPKSSTFFGSMVSQGGNLKDGETFSMVKSISVPWDVSDLTVENFEIRIRCESFANCDLSNYVVCTRVMCEEMDEKQAMEVLGIQGLITNSMPPTPELTAEQKEEMKIIEQEKQKQQPMETPIQPHRPSQMLYPFRRPPIKPNYNRVLSGYRQNRMPAAVPLARPTSNVTSSSYTGIVFILLTLFVALICVVAACLAFAFAR